MAVLAEHRLRDLPPIGRCGRYELLGRVARGGMAEIFLARERGARGVSRIVAVKRILPHVATDTRFVEMFRWEAALAMRLNHPNICAVYEFGEEDEAVFLAMEWVKGVSLANLAGRAKRLGPGLPLPLACRIIADVAKALDHAHAARDEKGEPLGIVHRDVSPENVMIREDGVVKLLDFGVAKASAQRDSTQAGVIKGKLAYISPEQYAGSRLDARSDLFAVGVCMFEAVTGEPLYHRESEYETIAAIVLDQDAPSPKSRRPALPDAVDSIVVRALQKSPDARFPSSAAMQEAIERFLTSLPEAPTERALSRFVRTLFAQELEEGPLLDRELRGSLPPPARNGSLVEASIDAERLGEVDDIAVGLARRARMKRWLVAVLFLLVVLGVGGLVVNALLRPAPETTGFGSTPGSRAPR